MVPVVKRRPSEIAARQRSPSVQEGGNQGGLSFHGTPSLSVPPPATIEPRGALRTSILAASRRSWTAGSKTPSTRWCARGTPREQGHVSFLCLKRCPVLLFFREGRSPARAGRPASQTVGKTASKTLTGVATGSRRAGQGAQDPSQIGPEILRDLLRCLAQVQARG